MKSHTPIQRIFKEQGWEFRPRGSPTTEVDIEEVRRLYFDEDFTQQKVADHLGLKSIGPIVGIFKEQDWEPRTFKTDVDIEEVRRLYFDEGLSQRGVADHLGLKSYTPIQRIFKEQGWKSRPDGHPKIELDIEEVRRLYFDEGLSQRGVADHLGLKSYTPIQRIFKEQGWEPRYTRVVTELNIEEVRRLYFDEGLSQQEVAEHLRLHSRSPIQRIFKAQGWESRFNCTRISLDIDELRRLYFDEGLSIRDIANRLGLNSIGVISRRFEEQGWKTRFAVIREDGLTSYERIRLRVNELQAKLIGTECAICGKPREIMHKKNGERHDSKLLWTIKGLMSIDPNDWAPVCSDHHLATHSLMKHLKMDWESILNLLKTKLDKKEK